MTMKISLHTFSDPTFESVVQKAIEFFDKTPIENLPPSVRFSGAGVYALYYTGGFEAYQKISAKNQGDLQVPIYIGKAVPSGWRTARIQETINSGVLYGRLREHSRSVQQTSNLDPTDFKVRFMVLKGLGVDLVVPVEAELIRRYNPLWNSLVDGFGNHDPGSGRYNQAVSEWDVLHPGRSWTTRLTGNAPDRESILLKVREYAP